MDAFGQRRFWVPGFGYVGESEWKTIWGTLGSFVSTGTMYAVSKIGGKKRKKKKIIFEPKTHQPKRERVKIEREKKRTRLEKIAESQINTPPPLEDIPMVTTKPVPVLNKRSLVKSAGKKNMAKRKNYKRRSNGRKKQKRRRTKSNMAATKKLLQSMSKAMEKKMRRIKNTSPVQKFRQSNAFPIAPSQNQCDRVFIPWASADDPGHGIMGIIDATLPTVAGTAVTWRDLSKGQSAGYINKARGSRLVTKMRNNDKLPATVRVYEAYCVESNAADPVTEFNNFIQDHAYDDAAPPNVLASRLTTPLLKMASYTKNFRDWKVRLVKTKNLEPTAEMTYVFTPKKATFNVTNYVRSHTGTPLYVHGWSSGIILEVVGRVTHDAMDQTLVGYGGVNIDIVNERYINFTVYQGEIKQAVRVLEGYDTMPNGPVAMIKETEEAAEGGL
jgi:hypothetical protein